MPRSDRQIVQWQNRHLGTNLPVPPVRKKRDNVESRAQASLIDWWRVNCAKFHVAECLLFSVPNGGWRDAVGGAILKREGARAGVPDLFLSVPNAAGHNGAYIEMKAPEGVVSDAQRAFLQEAVKCGYATRVCYSVESAMDFIRRYLAGEEF